MQLTSNFSIKDTVKVIGIDTIGKIDAVMFEESGLQYRVIYWLNGERKTGWLYDWELEKKI